MNEADGIVQNQPILYINNVSVQIPLANYDDLTKLHFYRHDLFELVPVGVRLLMHLNRIICHQCWTYLNASKCTKLIKSTCTVSFGLFIDRFVIDWKTITN